MQRIIAAVVVRQDGRVLLLKRSLARKSFPGKWNFVSGVIEDETPRECALREVREELGTGFKTKLVREGVPLTDTQPEGSWEVHPFLFAHISGEPRLDGEHTEFLWTEKEKVAGMDTVPNITEDLKRLGLLPASRRRRENI